MKNKERQIIADIPVPFGADSVILLQDTLARLVIDNQLSPTATVYVVWGPQKCHFTVCETKPLANKLFNQSQKKLRRITKTFGALTMSEIKVGQLLEDTKLRLENEKNNA